MAESNERLPVPRYSDQRYYHIAVLEGRRWDFGAQWLCKAIGRQRDLGPGRFGLRSDEPNADSEPIWNDLRFLCLREVESFAGSPEARTELAPPKGLGCDYDIFVGELGVAKNTSSAERRIAVVGTGYAALTTHVMKELLAPEQLASKAEFCVPRLGDLVKVCKVRPNKRDPMDLVITGINAIMPGNKRVSSVRLSGPGVLRDGLYDVVETFLASLGEDSKERGAVRGASKRRSAKAIPRAIRLRGTMRLTDRDSSVSFGRDGSVRLWLRKNGTNMGQFGFIIRELISRDLFERTTTHPKWSDDSVV